MEVSPRRCHQDRQEVPTSNLSPTPGAATVSEGLSCARCQPGDRDTSRGQQCQPCTLSSIKIPLIPPVPVVPSAPRSQHCSEPPPLQFLG